jgi:hypothetical protein
MSDQAGLTPTTVGGAVLLNVIKKVFVALEYNPEHSRIVLDDLFSLGASAAVQMLIERLPEEERHRVNQSLEGKDVDGQKTVLLGAVKAHFSSEDISRTKEEAQVHMLERYLYHAWQHADEAARHRMRGVLEEAGCAHLIV